MLETVQRLRRILVVQLGTGNEVAALSSATHQLKTRFPNAEIVLLCQSSTSRIILSLPSVSYVLVHPALSEQNSLSDTASVLDLIQVLQTEAFDAAILLPYGSVSPHPIAYVCYLAGIPIRIGQSAEFGGGVLSHWIRAEDEDKNAVMLKALGVFAATAGGV